MSSLNRDKVRLYTAFNTATVQYNNTRVLTFRTRAIIPVDTMSQFGEIAIPSRHNRIPPSISRPDNLTGAASTCPRHSHQALALQAHAV